VVPEIVRGWLNESTSPEGGSVQFHIVGPGQILPPAGAIPPGGAAKGSGALMQAKTKLADGTKIEISREGHEPAKVVVTRDKEKWEGTSNDLSKIPENIRPDVERLLHPAFDHDSFFAKQGATGTIVAGGPVALFSGAIRPPGGSGLSVVSPEVEKRLSDLQKQVDELRRAVDALQSQPAKKSKTAKSE
jgi:hypothetical protein